MFVKYFIGFNFENGDVAQRLSSVRLDCPEMGL